MKLRRFVGPTVQLALAQVKQALGPEAMILETRAVKEAPGGFEVTAAVDDDPAPSVSSPSADAALAQEVRELSSLVRALVGRASGQGLENLEPALGELYTSLVSYGIDGQIAGGLIEETAKAMSGGLELRSAVAAAVGSGMHFESAEERRGAKKRKRARKLVPRVQLFCGPPGDGKTTTIAKLAGRRRVEEGRRVALISTDTYRVSGAEELAAYAHILDVPLARVGSAAELGRALDRFAGAEEVLIDTAGVGLGQGDPRAELGALVEAVPDAGLALVVSATTAPRVVRDVWAFFKSLRPGSCIVTKVDAAPVAGVLEALWQQKLPLSFFGTGRRIPQDLEAASPEKMAARLMAA